MSPSLLRFALPVLLAGSVPCSAQEIVPTVGYLGGSASVYAPAGYGANLVDGSYVGAPLARVPSPRELVPSAWGYGTYGVPTVSGIRRAPVGEPVVYVIQGQRPTARNQALSGLRVTSRERGGHWSGFVADEGTGGGARIVQVQVPRRSGN